MVCVPLGANEGYMAVLRIGLQNAIVAVREESRPEPQVSILGSLSMSMPCSHKSLVGRWLLQTMLVSLENH